MKKYLMLLTLAGYLLTISVNSSAQEPDQGKIKELYLSGNLLSFSSLGLGYKSEIIKGTFLRIGIASLNTQMSFYVPPSSTGYKTLTTNIGGTFDLGFERRVHLSDRLTAFYGMNFNFTASFRRLNTDNPTLPVKLRYIDTYTLQPGLGFNSGFILKITESLFASAEIVPQLSYSYQAYQSIVGNSKVNSITNGPLFVLNSQSARLSLIYRWNKK